MSNDEQRYPIGRFIPQPTYSAAEIQANVNRIELLPERIADLTRQFSAAQWDKPYRDGGWKARQVVHHLADSHMNAYIRFKWSLTEPTPTIKAYDEKAWAETPEVALDPFLSWQLLQALHLKWVAMMKLLSPADWTKAFVHPETGATIRLDRMAALYAWHGEHHLGHLRLVAQDA